MGVESSLPFRRVPMLHATAWISLAVLLVALGLLAFVMLLGLINPGLSPENEPLLMGPFRWGPPPSGG
jgi:hypothetical protein